MEFLKGLVDLKFNKFITPIIAGALLLILYILATLGWLIFLFKGNPYTSFFTRFIEFLILYPLTIIGIRLWLEFIVAMTKTADNTSKILEELKEKK